MTMRRRTFLSLSAAGAVGLSLSGAGQALASISPQGAPTTPFATF